MRNLVSLYISIATALFYGGPTAAQEPTREDVAHLQGGSSSGRILVDQTRTILERDLKRLKSMIKKVSKRRVIGYHALGYSGIRYQNPAFLKQAFLKEVNEILELVDEPTDPEEVNGPIVLLLFSTELSGSGVPQIHKWADEAFKDKSDEVEVIHFQLTSPFTPKPKKENGVASKKGHPKPDPPKKLDSRLGGCIEIRTERCVFEYHQALIQRILDAALAIDGFFVSVFEGNKDAYYTALFYSLLQAQNSESFPFHPNELRLHVNFEPNDLKDDLGLRAATQLALAYHFFPSKPKVQKSRIPVKILAADVEENKFRIVEYQPSNYFAVDSPGHVAKLRWELGGDTSFFEAEVRSLESRKPLSEEEGRKLDRLKRELRISSASERMIRVFRNLN